MSVNLSTTNSVLYQENALVIRIATASPESLHCLLMKGLVASLRNVLFVEDRLPEDVDGLVAVSQLLQQMLPSEMHLTAQSHEN